MRSLKLGWIIFFSIVVLLSGTGYHFYSKQAVRFERHAANLREMQKLQEQQSKLMKPSTESEEETDILKILAKKQGDLWFLEDIEERLGVRYSPTFLLIGPIKREDKKNHITFSRKISLEASFTDLVSLLEELETKRGFMVNQLQVNLNPLKPERHRVNFWLSCIKIKEGFLKQFGLKSPPTYKENPVVASLLLDAPWKVGQKLQLNSEFSDPFVKLKRKKLAKKKKKVQRRRWKAQKPKVLLPIDLTGKYTVQGVVKLAGQQIILIAPDHVLKEGDLLDTRQLIKIEEDRIILQKGKQKYFLKLPVSVVPLDETSHKKSEISHKLQKQIQGAKSGQSVNLSKSFIVAERGENSVTAQ